MDNFEYIKIVEEIMLPYAKEEMLLKWVFQKDTDSKHSSKQATSWFQTKRIEGNKSGQLNPPTSNLLTH